MGYFTALEQHRNRTIAAARRRPLARPHSLFFEEQAEVPARFEPAQDEDESFVAEPPVPVVGVKVSVGVGKTQEALEAIARFLRRVEPTEDDRLWPRRIAILVPNHRLAHEEADRLRVIDPSLRVSVWLGQDAPDPIRPEHKMCRRTDDAGRLRQGGGRLADLCGSRQRGFCPHHEKMLAGLDGCGYRRQWVECGSAEVVIFAGMNMLTKPIPSVLSRRGHDGKVLDEFPAFDGVVIDEPSVGSLLRGLEGDLRASALTLSDLAAEDLLNPKIALTPTESNNIAKARETLLPGLRHVLEIYRARPSDAPSALTLAEAQAVRSKLLCGVRTAYAAILPLKYQNYQPKWWADNSLRLRHNATVLQIVRLIDALDKKLRMHNQVEPDVCVPNLFLSAIPAAVGYEPALIIASKEAIHSHWQVPTLILDASLREAILTEWWPSLQVEADCSAGHAPNAVYVRQIHDLPVSYRWLGKPIDGDHLRCLAAYIVVTMDSVRRRRPNVTGLVVGPKALEEALVGFWNGRLPPGLSLAHYGAVRGKDGWTDVSWLCVISRPLPPSDAIQKQAFLARGIVGIEADYLKADAVYAMADGTGKCKREARFVHPDPLAEEWRAAACEDEVRQAIGRARAVRRTAGNPLHIDVLTNVPVPDLVVDELCKFAHVVPHHASAAAAVLASRGIWLDPRSKGYWPMLAALTGYPSGDALRKQSKRAQTDKSLMGGVYKGSVRLSPILPAPASLEAVTEWWAPVLLKLNEDDRFAVKARVRAATFEEAKAVLAEAAAMVSATAPKMTAFKESPARTLARSLW